MMMLMLTGDGVSHGYVVASDGAAMLSSLEVTCAVGVSFEIDMSALTEYASASSSMVSFVYRSMTV